MSPHPGPPGSLLNLDASRHPARPVDAATLVLLRDKRAGLEVFCVERNRRSRVMGGALVFPGGKVDLSDHDPAWQPLLLPPRPRLAAMADDPSLQLALAVAACRESLEEAAILPVSGSLTNDEVLALRHTADQNTGALRNALAARGLAIDLASLVPFARWVTPEAELRRFDARFFMLRTPAGQDGTHDEHETMASFWATPRNVLARWEARDVQLAPPTHRTLQFLSEHENVDAALAAAETTNLDPICPQLVDYDGTLALTLPGDPDHQRADRVVEGQTRYVLRDEQWRPEDPPL